MATDKNQVAAALRKDLLKGMALWDGKDKMRVGDRLVGGNVVNDTQDFIKIAHFTRPILPQETAERQSFAEGRYDAVRTKTYSGTKYGLLVSFSNEALKDNQYKDVLMQTWGTDLMDLCDDRREILLQNEFFNLANSNTGPDGAAYGSASHPLDAEAAELTDDNTTNASNILSPAMSASPAALNEAAGILQRQRDNKGIIGSVPPPYFIECHVLRTVIWDQVAAGQKEEPFTPDRNVGAPYAKMIAGIIPVPYATHKDWFAVRTSNSRRQHRFVWDREKAEASDLDYIKKDDTWEGNVKMRIAKGIFDWRGIVYSFAGA